ncbi:hypothetical protein [Actinomycetospora aeridis]|uniref:Uncharacterized protein n=1 Tax=Actinomycetospora aeridis TaxID=3129231 RepID=A0ABU8N1A8_9PSEU
MSPDPVLVAGLREYLTDLGLEGPAVDEVVGGAIAAGELDS